MRHPVVNIGYCQQHFKGGDGINPLPGAEHAAWLEQAVLFWKRLCPYPILVSVTGFTGWPDVDCSTSERDTLWRIFGRTGVRMVTMSQNPGHQVGAAWCIRLGLEAAGKLGYDYMIHTAEDVVPDPDAVPRMLALLDETGKDYAGANWGRPDRDECNTQFFVCRTGYLGGVFDPCSVTAHGYIERYLRSLLPDERVAFTDPFYRTTHDHQTWTQWTLER